MNSLETIRGLIKLRKQYDALYERNNELLDLTVSHQDLANQLEEVICLYVTLDDYIEKCGLTELQKKVAKLFMDGYIELEVAEILGYDQSTINNITDRICKKILKYNNYIWKYGFIYKTKKKVDFDYKKCSKCNEYKPKINEFYGNHPGTADGFQHICKRCDNIRKNKENIRKRNCLK